MSVLPISDPSLTTNVGGQSVQAREVIGKYPFNLFLLSFPAGLVSNL